MSKVAIMTDSNSGLSLSEAREYGISVVPMPFFIDGKVFYEGVTISRDEFFAKLNGDADISTSQPEPATVIDMWSFLLKDHDEVVYVPMSSGLSGACNTAKMLSREFDGRVRVVDNQRISVPLVQSLLDARKLADEINWENEFSKVLAALR